jgi:hypothetical protein
LAKALAQEAEGLPEDFAARVAVLAEGSGAARKNWPTAAMSAAFVGMIGVCAAGWSEFVSRQTREWLGTFVHDLARQPWLITGIVGFVLLQMLTYRRRATS